MYDVHDQKKLAFIVGLFWSGKRGKKESLQKKLEETEKSEISVCIRAGTQEHQNTVVNAQDLQKGSHFPEGSCRLCLCQLNSHYFTTISTAEKLAPKPRDGAGLGQQHTHSPRKASSHPSMPTSSLGLLDPGLLPLCLLLLQCYTCE